MLTLLLLRLLAVPSPRSKHFLVNALTQKFSHQPLDLDGQQFDFIFMKDVFHHLEPRKQIVKKIGEILAPGGSILIIEPNFWIR